MLFDCVCDALNFWDWSEVNVFSMGIELDCWMRRNIFRSFSNNFVISIILLFSRGRLQRLRQLRVRERKCFERFGMCICGLSLIRWTQQTERAQHSVDSCCLCLSLCRLTDNRRMFPSLDHHHTTWVTHYLHTTTVIYRAFVFLSCLMWHSKRTDSPNRNVSVPNQSYLWCIASHHSNNNNSMKKWEKRIFNVNKYEGQRRKGGEGEVLLLLPDGLLFLYQFNNRCTNMNGYTQSTVR